MPQASTVEFLRKLRDLTQEYSGRCTPIELLGALHWQQADIIEACTDCVDGADPLSDESLGREEEA